MKHTNPDNKMIRLGLTIIDKMKDFNTDSAVSMKKRLDTGIFNQNSREIVRSVHECIIAITPYTPTDQYKQEFNAIENMRFKMTKPAVELR